MCFLDAAKIRWMQGNCAGIECRKTAAILNGGIARHSTPFLPEGEIENNPG
jgi:hypothetical protein